MIYLTTYLLMTTNILLEYKTDNNVSIKNFVIQINYMRLQILPKK